MTQVEQLYGEENHEAEEEGGQELPISEMLSDDTKNLVDSEEETTKDDKVEHGLGFPAVVGALPIFGSQTNVIKTPCLVSFQS